MREHDPTPEEIQRMCEEIRSKWSKKEKAKRRIGFHKVKFIPKYVYLKQRLDGVTTTIKLV